ncbi:MAG: GTP-binding protein TypA/BipA [Parcubacteria group bacterium Gr01-1014_33]|nr:MAG: GTP-binding protein TypA/BipA [Parcubacteria group bacterium Gr01-1014_33]
MEIRNIAIIAHVDHGKTTLTDALMRQTGMTDEGITMDSNALEQERGITIYSKNCSLFYPPPHKAADGQVNATKINIVDTPGHADFGSEVERVLGAIDSVLLIVDAQEGPMPQTRFVLKKSLELGLKPIVVINKIDKTAADPGRTHDQVLDLFIELGANDAQLDFPVIYTIGREGIAKRNLTDDSRDLTPLLDLILEKVPPANADTNLPFRMQPFNLGYDNFLGRLAIGRVHEGTIRVGDEVIIKKSNGDTRAKITKLFTFHGLLRKEVSEISAGDIVMLAGIPDIDIGETICVLPAQEPLPAITIDEPTISLRFLVNDSPFGGREGKFVTTRHIRERLERELQVNVGLKVDFSTTEYVTVYGRGELHIAILLENMRREGYELQVSQPQVIIKEENGQKLEPFEEAMIDAPSLLSGTVIERMSKRKGIMTHFEERDGIARIRFEIPTRGLLGFRGDFMIDTKGEGILTSRVIGFLPYAGEIKKGDAGSMVSMTHGKALAFSLANLQDRGMLYIGPGTEVYEGMVVGNVSKGNDMAVNPTKGKQLTNMRAAGSDEKIQLTPPQEFTLERGLEVMAEDEYLEVTPKSVRLRKQILNETERRKNARKQEVLKTSRKISFGNLRL